MEEINIPRINNFDIIRLLAALQVVFRHSQHHFELEGIYAKIGTYFLNYFPGVPIFFCISGFLIFWSFDRNSEDIKKYFKNRFLRLFPALWFCFLITVGLLLYDAQSSTSLLQNSSFYIWIVGQISFFQFWTPDILRFWGTRTPNGSLWTIIVEIQFYILVPIIYFFRGKNNRNLIIYILFFLSLLGNIYIGRYGEDTMIYKMGGVTILPYLYNFLMGVLAYIFWDKIKGWVTNKFLIWFSIYLLYIVVFGNYLGYNLNSYFIYNPFHLLTNVILSFVVLSAAFTSNSWSKKLLKGNDISYGIYIYHMLIINFLVQRNYIGSGMYMLYTYIAVIVISFLSWKFIEKPALNLKKKI